MFRRAPERAAIRLCDQTHQSRFSKTHLKARPSPRVSLRNISLASTCCAIVASTCDILDSNPHAMAAIKGFLIGLFTALGVIAAGIFIGAVICGMVWLLWKTLNSIIRSTKRTKFTAPNANFGINIMKREIIIKDTHRGLQYLDGKLLQVLGAGRYTLKDRGWFGTGTLEEIVLVDVRQRDLTIKGQEILTADKVAIRVSIITQFQVTDPRAALHNVENYEDRLYSDVQLAARRSLASMNLEEILTNRNQLSEDISRDVTESAASYGVLIARADVKDLIFPGNLQEIMNRVLTAERMSQAQLVESRTKAEQNRIEATARNEIARVQAEQNREATRLNAQAEAEASRIRTAAELETLQQREGEAQLYQANPSLLRLRELETLSALAGNAEARIYIGFDKHAELKSD